MVSLERRVPHASEAVEPLERRLPRVAQGPVPGKHMLQRGGSPSARVSVRILRARPNLRACPGLDREVVPYLECPAGWCSPAVINGGKACRAGGGDMRSGPVDGLWG
jgi:hypothetical protein